MVLYLPGHLCVIIGVISGKIKPGKRTELGVPSWTTKLKASINERVGLNQLHEMRITIETEGIDSSFHWDGNQHTMLEELQFHTAEVKRYDEEETGGVE